MRHVLATDHGGELYGKRQGMIELVFATQPPRAKEQCAPSRRLTGALVYVSVAFGSTVSRRMTDPDREAARAAYAEILDDELARWDLVMEMQDWASLLLGNGASMAVWDGFGYTSLYDEAVGDTVGEQDEAVFEALDTRNFEAVLRDLRAAALISDALGLDAAPHMECYDRVRHALADAVHGVHIPWVDVDTDALVAIKAELLQYDSVFTTNYDLLTYWAAMCDELQGNIVDYFWSSTLVFDPLNTEVWNKATKLLFLHGGLHLCRMSKGQTLKRTATLGSNLLDLFGEPPADDPGAMPLFVSEGESEDKLAAIRSSDYLSFALAEFHRPDVPLVVFGQSLSHQDQHLVDVLRTRRAPIAISMRQAPPDDVSATKAGYRNLLRNQQLLFFDAATHPLGDAALQCSG